MTDITYEDEAPLSIIDRAKALAVEAHSGQTYGDLPYEAHLQNVVDVMTDFGWTNPSWLAAAWLHDTIEDTDVTREQIEEDFGPLVASIVWAVTGTGDNRRERNQAIYDKMLSAPEASILKVADRIANVEHSSPGSKHRDMYIAEKDAFYDNVARFVPVPMLNRLNDAYWAN